MKILEQTGEKIRKSPLFLRMCNKLGKANDSEITTATIAVFKSIFVPIAVMMDDSASPEQKKYTASRAFVTELVAMVAYIGGTKILKEICMTPICEAYYRQKANLKVNMKKIKEYTNKKAAAFGKEKELKELDKSNLGQYHKSIVDKIETLNKTRSAKKQLVLPEPLYLNSKSVFSHIVVCTLALLVIPSMCNVLLPHFMKLINKNQKKEKPAISKNNEPAKPMSGNFPRVPQIFADVHSPKLQTSTYFTKNNYGNMRIGT